MPVPPAELIGRYERLSSSVVCDILNAMGHSNQALSSDIQPLDANMAAVGPAFTVEGCDERESSSSPPSYQVFRNILPDSVIVMTTGGHRRSGPWGENAGLTAQVRGARGIVIDGGTRDANALVSLAFPTFCRYVTPVIAKGRYRMTDYQKPISIAGQVEETVEVTPGDFVIADRDGVVIVPQALTEEVLVAAERLEEIEDKIRAGLLAGEDREVVYARHPKFDHVRKPRS